jgi:hypothetical protein
VKTWLKVEIYSEASAAEYLRYPDSISGSRRIFELLGLTQGGHHDAPLVPDAPGVPAPKKSKAAASARID